MNSHTIPTLQLLYNNHIYERYKSLIASGLTNENLDNNHLCKIFEGKSEISPELLRCSSAIATMVSESIVSCL